jgi:hypothetical protein
MMKAVKVWVCVAAIVAGGMLTWQASAQETPAKPAAKTDPRGPLPAQFGKLGISDEVKDELYKIHDEYDAQIQTLTAQIKKLQAEKTAKMEVKLTPAQKTRLKELRDEANAKRAAAAKLKADAEKPGVTSPVPAKKAE